MSSLVGLMAIAYFVQVLLSNPGLVSLSLSLYLKETLDLTASQLALFSGLVFLPWMVKPFLGVVVDQCYLSRSRTRFLLIMCYGVALGILLQLSRLQFFTVFILASGAIAISTAIALSDVLVDKIMVVEGKENQRTATLQAVQWSALGLGGILTFYLGGWVAKHLSLSAAFQVATLPAILALLTLPFCTQHLQSPQNNTENLGRSLQAMVGAIAQVLCSSNFRFLFGLMLLVSCSYFPPVLFYERDVLQFDEEAIGILGSFGSLGTSVGAIAFGLLASRVAPFNLTRHSALPRFCLAAALLSSLSWVLLIRAIAAQLAYCLHHFFNIMATLGLLELAIPLCTAGIEGTLYALVLSCLNLTSILGMIVGAGLYDAGVTFPALIGLSVCLLAMGWMVVSRQTRNTA